MVPRSYRCEISSNSNSAPVLLRGTNPSSFPFAHAGMRCRAGGDQQLVVHQLFLEPQEPQEPPLVAGFHQLVE